MRIQILDLQQGFLCKILKLVAGIENFFFMVIDVKNRGQGSYFA